MTETTLAGISIAELEHEHSDQRQQWVHNDVRGQLPWKDESLQVLHQFFTWFSDSRTPAHIMRYWQLLHWLDQPTPPPPRQPPPPPVLPAAHPAGSAPHADHPYPPRGHPATPHPSTGKGA